MYELADWGSPAPAESTHVRERIDIRLPVGLVRVLRSRARAEGVSLSLLLERFTREAMHLEPARRSFVD